MSFCTLFVMQLVLQGGYINTRDVHSMKIFASNFCIFR